MKKSSGCCKGESHKEIAAPDIPVICAELQVLGRWRRQVMKKQRHVNQPSIQCWVSELHFQVRARTGKDPDMALKQMFDKASRARGLVMKAVGPDWEELIELNKAGCGPEADKAAAKFKSCLNQECGGALDEDELEVAVIQASSLLAEKLVLQVLDGRRSVIEKRMVLLAGRLHVADWWQNHAGCGLLNLANIVCETGDLFNYANPDKVKKRMGLTVYEGKAPSTWRSKGGLKAADWEEIGYDPDRRSVMYNVGGPIQKCMKGSAGDWEFHDILEARKRREVEKAHEAGLEVVTTCKATADAWKTNGMKIKFVKAVDPDRHISAGHINNRALRYMEQQILIKLWARWVGK